MNEITSYSSLLCGVPFRLYSADVKLLGALARLWSEVFVSRPVDDKAALPKNGARLRISEGSDLPADDHVGQVIQLSPVMSVRHWASTSWLETVGAHLVASADASVLKVDARFWDVAIGQQRDFLLNAALILLQPFGRHGIHASAATLDGNGVLFTALSGSGKTTSTLSLIAHGWSYLSDDALVLSSDGTSVRAHALRRGFSWTEDSRSRFQSLYPDDGQWLPGREGKWLAKLGGTALRRQETTCVPKLVLFPEVAHTAHSRLEPVEGPSALIRLMEQSSGLLARPVATADQMKMLGLLVDQVRTFRFLAGRDVLDDAGAVSDLIQKAWSA